MVLYMCKITTDKTYITKLITLFFIDIFLSLFYKQSARLRSGFCFFIINSYVLNDREIIKKFRSSLFKG
nr:MAG TPA: hypothetical protein [Caudoviricetes sp.]